MFEEITRKFATIYLVGVAPLHFANIDSGNADGCQPLFCSAWLRVCDIE